ncbi:FAD-binding oxidoreductase [Bradyrhizobium jicamae]|uniref:FAD-binding oxidoreductase n=1 Tax=Bradyrhizobium jicamae TaxID=280332 RepID=UPI001BAAB618|nr:FAD-binding oxidoreductase [Bradyrhizobium jicamae]MBR0755299.1 FAD-binding oxidoreductase [Bradyrhizobium jicamae]
MSNSPSANVFADFPGTFKGPIYRPGDDGYEDVKAIWNARRSEDRPALIVQALDADDVVVAVKYAESKDVPVAVKSGGHGVDASAMPHNAFVIDTSRMKRIVIEPETGCATVDAGVLLGEMDVATQKHGYVIPAGVVTRTGVAGLTLGGGIGNLTRRFGATVDNLLSVDVVTMDGRKLRVSEETDAELFWGLCGAGHNLAIATSFTFQARKVGPQVMSGWIIYTAEAAVPLLAGLDEVMANAPRELTIGPVVLPAPPVPGLPAEIIGKPIVMAMIVYTGALEKFESSMRGIRDLAVPAMDLVKPSTWVEANSMIDNFVPTGRRQYLLGGYLSAFTRDVARVAIERIAVAPQPTGAGPSCLITFPILGGALFEKSENSTAFSRTGAAWLFEAAGQWDPPGSDEEYMRWVTDTMSALAPHATANAYINLTADRGPEWLRGAYGSREKWDRIVALKRKWDPHNRLSYNKNVIRAEGRPS